MAKIQAGQPVDLVTLSKAEAKIGDYKWSHLEPTEFGDEHLGTWFLCNGQPCGGTTFAAMTGETNVPNALTDGTFIRQAKSGRTKGSFEGDAIRNITGQMEWGDNRNNTGNLLEYATGSFAGFGRGQVWHQDYDGGERNNYSGMTFDASRQVPTADENRPKNIALNLYVKVNY